MAISEEEIMRIAKLSDLNIKKEEIAEYTKNIQDILEFAEVIKKVDTQNVQESIGTLETSNVFRQDEVKEFDDIDSLLQNAPDKENNMFKIPKVI